MNLHKIYGWIVAAVAVLLCFAGYNWLKAHDAWKDFQRDLAVSQEKIKQNKQVEQHSTVVEAAATQTIAKDNANNAAIDAALQKNLAPINAQLAKQVTGDDVVAILKRELPNLQVSQKKDAFGNDVLSVDNTQDNRNILNKADADFVSCRFDRDACQQKQQNYIDIIKQKDVFAQAQAETLAARQATILELQGNLKEATRFGKGGNIWSRTGRVMLPIACAAGAAWTASKAGADSKTVGIAAGASGGLCAFKFHF